MEKDQIIEVRIEDMLNDGRAFGRYEGCAVFVSGGCGRSSGHEANRSHGEGCADSSEGYYAGAVPGDLALVKLTRIRKNSAEAVMAEIKEPSPDRIRAECPYFGKCGGCSLQELSYEAQLALKREQLRSRLERLGGLTDPKINDTVGAEQLKYYRNKAVFAVGPHGEVGFMKAGTNHVLDIDDCMLQSDAAMVCADALRTFLRERGGRSLGIGRMTVRTAFGTGEVMVVLEAEDAAGGKRDRRKGKKGARAGRFEIPDAETLIEMLDDAVFSIGAGEEPSDGADEMDEELAGFYSLESVAVISGADAKKDRPGSCAIIAGKPTITEETVRGDGRVLRYEISPQSFYQVNPEQMVKLYDKALEYALGAGAAGTEDAPAAEEKKTSLLDLYCGVGTIGIWMADHFDQVIGIESVRPAVIDANRNSVINGLINTRYIAGRAEEELPGMMGLAKLYKWNEVNERVEREPEIKIGRKWRDSAAEEKEIGNKRPAAESSCPGAAEEKGIRNERTAAESSCPGTAEMKGIGNKRPAAENSCPGAADMKRNGNKAPAEGNNCPGTADMKGNGNKAPAELLVENVDVIVLDPPRAGCAEPLLAAAVTASPDRIVYVSCDPGTLARDVKYLTAHGYEFIEATPVDQFPWTSHIEVASLLQRVSNTRPKAITLDVEMEDYYRIKGDRTND